MKKLTAWLAVVILAMLGVMTSATAASATQFQPHTESARWLLPDTWPSDQTPTYQEAIFPQTRLDGELECGRWSQDDVYQIDNPDEQAIFDNLGDTLTMGEDGSIYLSHVFTYGGDCIPEQPEDEVTQTISTPVTDCEAGTITVTTVTTTTPYTWDGKSWIPGESTSVTTTDVTPTTIEQCPLEPPTKPEDRVTSETRDDTVCTNDEGDAVLTTYGRDTTFPTSLIDNVWVEGEGIVGDWYTISTNDVTAENCIIDTPPTEEPEPTTEPKPPVEVTPTPTPTPTETIVPAAVIETKTLASTGSNTDDYAWVAFGFIFAGVAAIVIVARIRAHRELKNLKK